MPDGHDLGCLEEEGGVDEGDLLKVYVRDPGAGLRQQVSITGDCNGGWREVLTAVETSREKSLAL